MRVMLAAISIAAYAIAMSGGIVRGQEGTAIPASTSAKFEVSMLINHPNELEISIEEAKRRSMGWAGERLSARIGNVECGRPYNVGHALSDGNAPPWLAWYRDGIEVLSADSKPGCGREGDVITFLLGSQQANETALWHAGSQALRLTFGPRVAVFSLNISPKELLSRDPLRVAAYIAGRQCSWRSFDPFYVYSEEHQAGCGTEGAQITFKVLDRHGTVEAVAREKGAWHAAWSEGYDSPQVLELTFVAVGELPKVGAPAAHRGPGLALEVAAAVLAAMGLGAIAAGAALRRRRSG